MPTIGPGSGVGVPAGNSYERPLTDAGRQRHAPPPNSTGLSGRAPMTAAQNASSRTRAALPPADSETSPTPEADTANATDDSAQRKMAELMAQFMKNAMTPMLEQAKESTRNLLEKDEDDEDADPDD